MSVNELLEEQAITVIVGLTMIGYFAIAFMCVFWFTRDYNLATLHGCNYAICMQVINWARYGWRQWRKRRLEEK